MTAFNSLLNEEIQLAVTTSLAEDLGILPSTLFATGLPCPAALSAMMQALAYHDVTAGLIDEHEHSQASVICKEDCIFVGEKWVEASFKALDPNMVITWHSKDGQHHKNGETLFTLAGLTRAILTAERTALNFAQTLSATATSVHGYAQILAGSCTQILDTRKTIPGMRYGQKYAVQCGGGSNHRIGLYDRYLIKENHIMGAGSIANAVARAKGHRHDLLIEVEVENLDELSQAIAAGVDIVMLDNFSLADINAAVALNQGQVKLEVSGNVETEHLKMLAKTGVDFVSSGAITKHINAIDLSLRLSQS